MNMLLFQILRAMGFQVDHQGGDPTVVVQKPRKVRKSVGGPVARTLINLAVTLAVGLVWFYIALPPLNFQAEEFYFFLFLLCAVYCVCAVFTSGFQENGAGAYFRFVRKQCRVPFWLVVLMAVVMAVGSIASWVVLRAGSYRDRKSVV